MLKVYVSGPIARAGIAALCERTRELLEASGADLLVVELGTLVDPDAVAVDALARLHLTARRLGRRIRYRGACREIHELVALMGLDDVLRLDAGSWTQRGREAEQREQAGGVEEEADP